MSLLQPCRQALSRSLAQRACASARLYTTNEGPTGTISQKHPADVVPELPTQEIIPADVFSGAPGRSTPAQYVWLQVNLST